MLYFFVYPIQARAHIDIKGSLSTCPFSSLRESAFFKNKLIYVYMCACVFLFPHSFPCQQIKKSKYQVGSGNVLMSFSPPHVHVPVYELPVLFLLFYGISFYNVEITHVGWSYTLFFLDMSWPWFLNCLKILGFGFAYYFYTFLKIRTEK